MTTDLRGSLRALHAHAHAAAPDLSPGPVVARARRRRALVRTGYGAVGAGAAAVLGLGAAAVSGNLSRPAPIVTTPDPSPSSEPPAPTASSSAPTPTPTPSTTSPSPAATPSAIAAAPFGEGRAPLFCGFHEAELATSIDTFTSEAGAGVTGGSTSVAGGKPWTGTVTIPIDSPDRRAHVEITGALAMRDGVVYGYADEQVAVETTGPMAAVVLEPSLHLRSCVGDGAAPLGGGTYDLRLLVDRGPLPDLPPAGSAPAGSAPAGSAPASDAPEGPEGEWETYPLILDAGTVRFAGKAVTPPTTATGTATFTVEPRPRARLTLANVCRQPFTGWPAASTYPFALQLASAERRADGELAITIGILNTGHSQPGWHLYDYPRVVVVRDGVVYGDWRPEVVATPALEDPDPTIDSWPAGAAAPVTVASDHGTCSTDTSGQSVSFTPWPAGEYQVYASWQAFGTVTGGPWTITLP